MKRQLVTLGLVLASVAGVAQARAVALDQFAPALAAEPSRSPVPSPLMPPSDPRPITVLATPTPTPTPEPATPEPTAAVAPVAAPAAPPPTAPPAPPAAAPSVSCPGGSWFCYPRLGISGAIVPYTDCSGRTDVGAQIRSFTCLSDHYLMAHAYTQFGRITGWQTGDVVFAYGRRFTVTGAFVQSACTQPRLPLAPLEMQTSLTSSACGNVLVVTAR